MKLSSYQRAVRIERSAAEVFAWHERPGALPRLMPPWEQAEVVSQAGGIRDGAQVVVRMKLAPGLYSTWRVRHVDYREGVQFRDVQESGPFAHFTHLHRFVPLGSDACELREEIEYRLPAAPFSRPADAWVRRRLEQLFTYRHTLTKADLEQEPAAPGRVLISGASGLLGQQLVAYLRTQGWDVLRLVRREARAADEVVWSPEEGRVDWPAGRPVDAVIHLAGANLAGGRWTDERKRAIMDSRVQGTRTLVQALLRAEPRPRVLISGSATGFYGDSGDTVLTEASPLGAGFLAEVCRAWEAETAPATSAGVRTVQLRTGVVLTPAGGALAKMLPLFRAGGGGRLGAGRQWMSWIALDDWLDVVRRGLTDDRLNGPLNAVAPGVVTNVTFTAVLAKVLRRPAVLPAPAVALRLVLGEMADEALLASTRAVPAALQRCAHRFRYPDLEGALRHGLGRITVES